ncbi:MAG: hypothetical protein RL417_1222 [Pseudomonadota bacterium]
MSFQAYGTSRQHRGYALVRKQGGGIHWAGGGDLPNTRFSTGVKFMDLATLAAKQKRAKDWADFIAAGEVHDTAIRRTMEERLAAFRSALKKVWEAEVVSAADEDAIEDLERQLVQLNEEARVRVVGKAQPRCGADSCGCK